MAISRSSFYEQPRVDRSDDTTVVVEMKESQTSSRPTAIDG